MAEIGEQDPLLVGTVGPALTRFIFGLSKRETIFPTERLEEKLRFGSAFGPIIGPPSLPGVALTTEILEALRDDIAANPGLSLEVRTLRNAAIINALQAPGDPSTDILVAVVDELHDELGQFLDSRTPRTLSFESLLETLSELLLNPSRVPGEPCLAPAPLLRDLLDIALGRLNGGIGDIVATVGNAVTDFLLPGFASEGELTHLIQGILDDPITAALNLVLGQQDKIDCVVEGGLGVAESVFEAGVRSLKASVAEGLG